MAAVDYEKVVLSGLNLATWGDIEALTFTPAAKKAQWVENADADGSVLVKESRYTNSFFELQVRAEHQSTTALALEKVGELLDAMQNCERTEGGAPLLWTPNQTESTYTAHALLAELVDVPIEVQGDLAGWLLKTPVIKLKVTCRPFLDAAERTLKSSTESGATPLQEVFLKGVLGDVPAEARLILTDKATQNRRFAAWGRDIVSSEEPPACLITAASLSTSEFSGEAKTRSGAYSEEKVKRGTAVSSATTMCGTGRIKHVGSFAVYMRVYAASTNARFRISYRNGDGPLIPLKWVTPPVIENFSELYMGEVFLDKVTLGEQTSEIRVEVKSAGASLELDVNYLMLWPSRAILTARGRANNTPTKLLAYDEFLQTEGSLSGKTLPIGGTWSGAGDAVDFTVIAASDYARRTEVSDADLNTGRYAIAGSTNYGTSQVSAQFTSTKLIKEAFRIGVFLRYSSAENWLMATLYATEETGGGPKVKLVVLKRVSGTVTVLGETAILFQKNSLSARTITLSALASGSWRAESEGVIIEGSDTALAVSGALETGKPGFYDAWTSATASTRTADTFAAVGADAAGVACYSGKAIEFNSDGVLRQDSTGSYDGQPDLPRGANFYLEPEGDNGTINRLVMRMRRNDVVEEADANVEDKHAYEVKVVERFLVPR